MHSNQDSDLDRTNAPEKRLCKNELFKQNHKRLMRSYSDSFFQFGHRVCHSNICGGKVASSRTIWITHINTHFIIHKLVVVS